MSKSVIPLQRRLPSTFTYVGRHLLGSLLVLNAQRSQASPRLGLLGSGPLEPLTTAHLARRVLSPGVRVIAFDRDPRLLALGRRLGAGEAVKLDVLAEHCANHEDTGVRRPNRNLLEPVLLQRDLDRLHALSGEAIWSIEDGHLSFVPIQTQVEWRDASLPGGLRAGELTAVFCGSLLVNLRKQCGEQAVIELARAVKQDCSGPVVFGITPAELFMRPSTPQLLRQAGWFSEGWLAENVVLQPGTARETTSLLGDIAVWVNRTAGTSHGRLESILERIALVRAAECPAGSVDALEPGCLKEDSIPVAGVAGSSAGTPDRLWSVALDAPATGLRFWSGIEDLGVPLLMGHREANEANRQRLG